MKLANPAMIVVARESVGMTQRALAAKLGVAQGTLSKIENGRLEPDENLIDRLCSILPYRRSFYFQNVEPKNLPVSFFRKRVRVSAARVKAVQANVNITREQLRTLLRSAEIPDLNLPIADPDEVSVPAVVRDVRERWALPPGPIENLMRSVEDAGIVVVQTNFGTRQVDALSVYSPEDGLPPTVFMNCGMPGDRMRFSLAHEIGHIIFHHGAAVPRDHMEDEANRFAAELLMPARHISSHLSRVRSLRDIASLKPHWRVSMAALIERAYSLEKITLGQRKYLWTLMSKRGYRTVEPYPIDPEAPTLVGELVETHLDDLGYDGAELSAILHISESDMADRFGISGRPAHLKLVSG